MMWKFPATYGANRSALTSSVRYSSQPDESTTIRLESLGVVAVVIAPSNSLRYAAQFLDGARQRDVEPAVERKDKELLPRLDFELFAHFLRDHNLELRRHFHFDRTHEQTSKP